MEGDLKRFHKALCAAVFQIGTMLVKRTASRSQLKSTCDHLTLEIDLVRSKISSTE